MLVEALGIDFVAVPAEVEERTDGDPRELVAANALAKARAVSARSEAGALVLGADTEVVLDGRALGKASDEAGAREHLESLSGRSHEVIGAIALIAAGPEGLRERTGLAASAVTFDRLDDSLVDLYLASGEWRGRAGSYAVQGLGSAFVASVEGDLANVIGLSIRLLGSLAPELLGA